MQNAMKKRVFMPIFLTATYTLVVGLNEQGYH
jgi:hypothetical protein